MLRDAARRLGLWRGRSGPMADVVFAGPLPPARTGIATYDRAVLDGLRRTGYAERRGMDVVWPLEAAHVSALPGYRLGVFQLGNNVEFHLELYRAAYLVPALVVLHDLALDDFVRGLRAAGEPLGFMAAREAAAHRRNLRSADVVRNEPLRLPWCAHVARRARGIVVHSDFGRRYLEELGCRTPVFVVPHPPVEEPGAIRRAEGRARELRRALEARGARTLVVAPGDQTEAKRLDAVVGAVGRLGDAVHAVVVGRRIEGYDVGPVVEGARLGGRVSVLHDVTDEDFLAWICAADVVVDLRFPHRGEVSGSLIRAMQAGRPTIVSGTGAYLDAPDPTVVRVAPGPTSPEELATAIRRLAEDERLRAGIGEAARAHVEGLRAREATARGYEEAIEATLSLLGDPAHMALAIWGKALADMDVDEAALAEGYGLGYARALAAFKTAR